MKGNLIMKLFVLTIVGAAAVLFMPLTGQTEVLEELSESTLLQEAVSSGLSQTRLSEIGRAHV